MTEPAPIAGTLASANKETLQEIVRQAEAYLQAQLTAAIAADQRALTMAGYLATAIAVLIGAAAALSLTADPRWMLASTGFALAVALLVSLYWVIKSAKPSDFEFPGNVPGEWVGDIAGSKKFEQSLAEQCEHYHGMAMRNNTMMKENAAEMTRATSVAFWSMIIAGIVFGIGVFAPPIISVCGA